MKVVQFNSNMVGWDCPRCNRNNITTISYLRSKVKHTVMMCVGKDYSVSGDKTCIHTVTVGEVLAVIDGKNYERFPEHSQLPVNDR